MSSSLYKLTGQMLYLDELMSDPDVEDDVIRDTMEALDMEIEDKADGYAKIIKMLGGEIEVIKAETDRLTKRKEALENNIRRLKDNLEATMIALDKKKFKTSLFSFGIQKNPPSVDITGKVPDQFYIKQEPKLDKKALIAFVKKNGNTDYAKLTQGESLRIR